MLTMLSALSQFERDLIAERTMDGLKAARARGRKGGRPPVGNARTKATAMALYEANTMTNNTKLNLKVNICGADFSLCLSRAEGGDAAHR